MKISRVSLHEEVLDRIRSMIIEQRWPPDTRFPEAEVCEELGVSRTPLREALKVLASEGLIELKTNRGAVIREFSPKETKETLLLMGELEALASAAVCEIITDEQLAEFAELHQRMLAYHANHERKGYWATNRRIHVKILEVSGNQVLQEMHKLLRTRMLPALYAASNHPVYEEQAVAEHERINSALMRRNGPELASLLREHQIHTWERVQKSLSVAREVDLA